MFSRSACWKKGGLSSPSSLYTYIHTFMTIGVDLGVER